MYPIKIKAPNYSIRNEYGDRVNIFQELQALEEGSYEDNGSPEEGHAYNAMTRQKTQIVIHNREEAQAIIKSLEYWRDCPTDSMEGIYAWGAALNRIANKIKKLTP